MSGSVKVTDKGWLSRDICQSVQLRLCNKHVGGKSSYGHHAIDQYSIALRYYAELARLEAKATA